MGFLKPEKVFLLEYLSDLLFYILSSNERIGTNGVLGIGLSKASEKEIDLLSRFFRLKTN